VSSSELSGNTDFKVSRILCILLFIQLLLFLLLHKMGMQNKKPEADLSAHQAGKIAQIAGALVQIRAASASLCNSHSPLSTAMCIADCFWSKIATSCVGHTK
jgi:hypothetical protein